MRTALVDLFSLGFAAPDTSSERLRRIRVLTATTLGLSLFAGVPWALLYSSSELPVRAGVMFAVLVAVNVNLALLWWTRRDRLAAHFAIAILASYVTYSAGTSGALDSPIYPWLLAVPLCGAAILGVRGAMGWTAAMAAVTVAFWWLQAIDHPAVGTPLPLVQGHLLMLDRLLLLVGVGVIGASFVQGQRKTEHELRLANAVSRRESTYRELLVHAATAASEAEGLSQALEESIPRICSSMGWPAGTSYEVDARGVSTFSGCCETSDEALERYRHKLDGRTFQPERGAVGEAAATGRSVLVPLALEGVPDAIVAAVRASGVQYAFAVPVLSTGDVVAVMEFGLVEAPDDEEDLKRVFSLVGNQLGRVVERQRLSEHLRRNQKMEAVARLAAGVAHEINNPMSFVRANLRHLDQELEAAYSKPDEFDLDESRELVTESLQGVEHTIEIVRGIREMSHMGRRAVLGDDELADRAVHPLAEIADRAIRTVLGRTGMRITLSAKHREEVQCLCSPGKIQQLATNLLTNAIDAVGESGVIELETGAHGDMAFLRVRDDGAGIAAEIQDHLFDPFFTTKGVGEGTGLGLSVSYEIARAHDGEIHLHSEPGAGTVFEVLLPRVR